MYSFNTITQTMNLIQWIKDYFAANGNSAPAVLGVSGGKDSTVAAALCVKAIGADRVIGIQLPNGIQTDIADSDAVFAFLGIEKYTLNIGPIVTYAYSAANFGSPNETVTTNLPARIRMSMLYMFANQHGGRVVCTDNLSETHIGYNTQYGDNIGDFAPLKGLTATEVVKIGEALDIPASLLYKTPHDGMSGKSDEERFGFTYAALDTYIRAGGYAIDWETEFEIKKWHARSEYKRNPMPTFFPV